MLIFSPGVREGILYQRTQVFVPSRMLCTRKKFYEQVIGAENCPLDKWIELHDWSWVTEPEQRRISIQSEVNWREGMRDCLNKLCCHHFWVVAYKNPYEDDFRHDRIWPYIREKNLEGAIDKAAAVFAKDAVIKTLEKPRFDQECNDRIREYPAPEGVLQYFRKECRRRRQKIIEEID